MNQLGRSLLVASYLLLCILLGGSGQGVWRTLALQLLGVALIAWATLFPSKPENPDDRPVFLYLLGALAAAIALLQLVPLPAGVWPNLPGRGALAEGLVLLGGELPSLPISQAPYRSVMALLAVIPGLALFIAVKMLRPSPAWLAAAIVLGLSASIVVGALQIAGGAKSWAYLYPYTNTGAVGLFANRNHMGTLLLVSIPFAVALLVSARSDRGGSRQGRMAIGVAALVLVVIGIILNGSLAVLALALPVMLASAALVPAAIRWRRLALPLAALGIVAAIGLLAANPVGGASRLGSDSSIQSRTEIWATTAEAIRDSMPVGAGLGTFSLIYRQYEDPGLVTSEYVNHAHNDYLELALELGLGGIALMALFLGWWIIAAAKVWTSPLSTPYGRAATIASAVILAHSVVDYPLRTSAIVAVFGTAIALIAQRLRSTPTRPTRHVKLG